jgi:glycosyltransferase involved in cell wall biosynthesis
MKKLPKVSIIIPTYNEESNIGNLLDSLTKVNYPKKKLEIIVVDDGSTDKTKKIASKYSIKLLKSEHKGFAHVRNLGWKKTSSEILIFLDADMKIHPNYIRKIITCLDDPKIAGSDHKELLSNKKNLIAKLLYLRKVLGWDRKKFLTTRACKKNVLKQVGGFNLDYGYYIDQELGLKILSKGYKITQSPEAVVWHTEPDSLKELWRQCKWMGESIIPIFKKNKKQGIRRFLFPILCTFLPVYIIFLLFPFPFWILGIVGLTFFLAIEIQRSIKMYKITKWKESFLTPFFDFFTMTLVFLGMFCYIIDEGNSTWKNS